MPSSGKPETLAKTRAVRCAAAHPSRAAAPAWPLAFAVTEKSVRCPLPTTRHHLPHLQRQAADGWR